MRSTTDQSRNERSAFAILVSVLLICGIASSLLYFGGEVLAARSYRGYSYANQVVSELAAVGAPTRPTMVVLFSIYNALVLAFAVGVWLAAGRRRSLRIAAFMLAVYAVVGQLTTLFSPMHMRGSPATATDAGHIVLTVLEVLSVVLFVAFASGVAGRGFRLYSIGTIVVLMAAGIAVGVQSAHMTAAAASTPWAGVLERVNIYGILLWVLVFAVMLLRERISEPAATGVATPAVAARGVVNIAR